MAASQSGAAIQIPELPPIEVAPEERFREIVDALPAAVYTTDAQGWITYFNPAAVAFAGRVPKPGSDRWCLTWKLYRPDGTPLPNDQCPMAIALKEGRVVHDAEFILERPDGSRIWFTPCPALLRDADGRITGAVNMLVDITERKRTEEALLSGEQQLRTVLHAGKFGHWESDRSGQELAVSPQCKAHFGLAADQPFTKETLWASIHPDDRETVEQALRQAFGGVGDYETDFRCIWPDGSIHWINAKGRAFGEGPAARLFGVTVDIIERKRAEAWLVGQKRVLEMLATGANLFDVLSVLIRALEAQADGLLGMILIRSEDGSRFEAGVGPSFPQRYIDGLVDAPLTPYLSPCATAVNRGVSVNVPDVLNETRWPPAWRELACRSGVTSCYSCPVFASDGRVLASFGMYNRAPESVDPGVLEAATSLAGIAIESRRNQQALQQSEAAARRSAEHLQRANFALQQFAYSASHDLQEPLRNIAVYSQIVGRRYAEQLDEGGREFVGYITAGAQRLEMLIRDLLAYTQISGAPDMESEPTEAAAALQGAISNLADTIRQTGAMITHDDLPKLRVRQIELQQLLQNLIGNAIKYRRPKEPPVVHISAKREGEMWRLEVRDNGIGIAPEYRETVFGMFKRLHSDVEYPGTGMGLAICRKVVERHGGTIGVESEVGHGSVFFFTLPGVEER